MNRRVTWTLPVAVVLVSAGIGCGNKKTEKTGTTGKTGTPATVEKTGKTQQKTSSKTVAENGGTKTPQRGPVVSKGAPPAVNGIDTRYITQDYVAAIVAHPSRVMNAKLVRDLFQQINVNFAQKFDPKKNVRGELTKQFGIDPGNVEQVVLLFDQRLIDQGIQALIGRPKRRGAPAPRFEDSKKPDFKKAPGSRSSPLPKNPKIEKTNDRSERRRGTPAFQSVSLLQDAKGPAFPEKRDVHRDEPAPAILVRTLKPVPEETVVRLLTYKSVTYSYGPKVEMKMTEHKPSQRTYAGKTYFVSASRFSPMAVCRVDGKTLVGATEPMLKKMLDAKGADSPLIRRLKALSPRHDLIFTFDATPTVTKLKELPRDRMPPLLVEALGHAAKVKTVTVTASLTDKTLLSLVVEFPGEADAKGLAEFVRKKAMPLGKSFYHDFARGPRAVLPPAAKPLLKLADQMIQGLEIRVRGSEFVATIARPADLDQLPRLAVPAIKAARAAAREAMRKNNMRQIGLAMHNFHDVFRRFPANDSNGEPTGQGRKAGLSWRVYILPHIEQVALYRQFKLDEPWDSPHNKKLISKMPQLFHNPDSKRAAADGKTSIHVFVGPGTPFDHRVKGETVGIRIRDIIDGTSNTLMAVEAGDDKAEIWTKPGGLPFDPKKNPLQSLGRISGDGFLAVFCDGFVGKIETRIKPETLSRLIQYQDGEPVGEIPGLRRPAFHFREPSKKDVPPPKRAPDSEKKSVSKPETKPFRKTEAPAPKAIREKSDRRS